MQKTVNPLLWYLCVSYLKMDMAENPTINPDLKYCAVIITLTFQNDRSARTKVISLKPIVSTDDDSDETHNAIHPLTCWE